MRRALAAAWLAIVVGAGVYLAVLGTAGFPIRTDLLALLPREERDPAVQQAKARLANDEAYRQIAQKAVAAQSENASALPSIQAALADIGTRLTAIEKILKEVE